MEGGRNKPYLHSDQASSAGRNVKCIGLELEHKDYTCAVQELFITEELNRNSITRNVELYTTNTDHCDSFDQAICKA